MAENQTSVMDQVSERVGKKKTSAKKSQANPDEPKQPAVEQSAAVAATELRVPMSTEQVAAFRLHADLNMTGDQAEGFRRLAKALDKNQTTLANGRRCVSTNDAIRWLGEELIRQYQKTENP